MYRIEHGSLHNVVSSWDDVLRDGVIGDSVFQWISNLGWLFIGEL